MFNGIIIAALHECIYKEMSKPLSDSRTDKLKVLGKQLKVLLGFL